MKTRYGVSRISTIVRLYRWSAGAVSLIVTVVPASATAFVVRCTQNVSPSVARNWLTRVCPAPSVRAVCPSQSLPTPTTSELFLVVTSDAVGAPTSALPLPVAPMAPEAARAGRIDALEAMATNPEGLQRWLDIHNNSQQKGAPAQPQRTPITYEKLEAIRVPTLLMPGDQDIQCPPWVMRRQLAHIPHAEFIVLPEASHSINWEQPEAFNRKVVEFIRKH